MANTIAIGIPLYASDVIDNVTTFYSDLLPAPGFHLPSPGQAPTIAYMTATFIAMICPPNLSARPLTIGVMDLLNQGTLFGIGIEMVVLYPIRAPDEFAYLESAVYASMTDAGNDINAQVDAYRAANPDVLVMGILVSEYSDGAYNNMITARIAGKLIP